MFPCPLFFFIGDHSLLTGGYSLTFSDVDRPFFGDLRNFCFMGVLGRPVPETNDKIPEIVSRTSHDTTTGLRTTDTSTWLIYIFPSPRLRYLPCTKVSSAPSFPLLSSEQRANELDQALSCCGRLHGSQSHIPVSLEASGAHMDGLLNGVSLSECQRGLASKKKSEHGTKFPITNLTFCATAVRFTFRDLLDLRVWY